MTDTGLFGLAGKSLNDVLKIANQKKDRAIELLVEAKHIYHALSSQNMDPYQLGMIRKMEWDATNHITPENLFFSRAGQDKYIYETFFSDKSDGLFLEVGGHNGWYGSNCFFFEKILGWKGVVIEPSPNLQNELNAVRSNEVLQAAISNHDGEDEFINITSGYTQMSGLASTYSAEQLKMVRNHKNHAEKTITVPSIRMDTLMKQRNINYVDYCSIDVEGAEYTVLSTIDFANVNIEVISVENNTANKSSQCRALLEGLDYELIEVIGVDEIYYRPL